MRRDKRHVGNQEAGRLGLCGRASQRGEIGSAGCDEVEVRFHSMNPLSPSSPFPLFLKNMSNRPEPADPPPHVLDIDLTEFEKLRIAQLETDGPIEDEELERFRDQWRHEVQAKRQEGASSVPGQRKGSERPPDPTGRAGITTVKAESPVRSTRRLSIHRDETPGAGAPKPSDVLPVQKHPRLPARVVEAKEQAVQLYARAVEKEQSSQLSEALMLYRKAFKLDGRPSFLSRSALTLAR